MIRPFASLRPALAPRFTLLRTFALCIALALALIAGALSWTLTGVIDGIAFEQEATQATVQATMLLHAGLLPHRLSTRLNVLDHGACRR